MGHKYSNARLFLSRIIRPKMSQIFTLTSGQFEHEIPSENEFNSSDHLEDDNMVKN